MLPLNCHLSQAAQRAQPGLADALRALGAVVDAGPPRPGTRVIRLAGEPGRGALAVDAGPPGLADGPAGPVLRFEPADARFAAALAADLMRAPGEPAAADPATRALFELAERVAASRASVLVLGPTGTGKEVLARFVHARSPRAGAPMLAVNCAALPEAMLEAILFGHERGAFTGAAAASLGLFRAADGGTLLLDEVAELPLALQAKLLRALQEGEVLPVGATAPVRVDVRVIAAANRDLRHDAETGRFRADLYWRLAVFPLATRPLADRPADLAPLAAALLRRHGAADARWWPVPAALDRLAAHDWPGNVRELDNVLQRALVLAGDGRIGPGHLLFDAPARHAPRAAAPGHPPTLNQIVRGREHAAIRAALAECGGRRIAAATRLGISERTLRYKLAEMARVGNTRAGAAA